MPRSETEPPTLALTSSTSASAPTRALATTRASGDRAGRASRLPSSERQKTSYCTARIAQFAR